MIILKRPKLDLFSNRLLILISLLTPLHFLSGEVHTEEMSTLLAVSF